MSWFGDGTLKQDLLEDIEYRMRKSELSAPEFLAELLEVVTYMVKYVAEIEVGKADGAESD